MLLATRNSDAKPVVIKFSTNQDGQKEIRHEAAVARGLLKVDFAAHVFKAPSEIAFNDTPAFTFRVTEFLPEEKAFIKLSTIDQFHLAVQAFAVQSGLHAATYGHVRQVKKLFGVAKVDDYIDSTKAYQAFIGANVIEKKQAEVVFNATNQLMEQAATIATYMDFLTHTDFVPHNVRLHDGELYLLDQTSLHFGNKHESWARFVNYMTLYNFELAQYLTQYIKDNRTEEEYQSFRMMRVYKLIYLLAFYTNSHLRTRGSHKKT